MCMGFTKDAAAIATANKLAATKATPLQRDIVNELQRYGDYSSHELSHVVSAPAASIRRNIASLRRKGFNIQTYGSGSQQRYGLRLV